MTWLQFVFSIDILIAFWAFLLWYMFRQNDFSWSRWYCVSTTLCCNLLCTVNICAMHSQYLVDKLHWNKCYINQLQSYKQNIVNFVIKKRSEQFRKKSIQIETRPFLLLTIYFWKLVFVLFSVIKLMYLVLF